MWPLAVSSLVHISPQMRWRLERLRETLFDGKVEDVHTDGHVTSNALLDM